MLPYCCSVHLSKSLQLSVCVSLWEDAVLAEIMLHDYTKAPFSAEHWSILAIDTELLRPCDRVGSTIFVFPISSYHWFLRAKLQICHSCCHPLLRASLLFSWDLAIDWKDPLGVANEPCFYHKCKKSLWLQKWITFFVLCFTLLYFRVLIRLKRYSYYIQDIKKIYILFFEMVTRKADEDWEKNAI